MNKRGLIIFISLMIGWLWLSIYPLLAETLVFEDDFSDSSRTYTNWSRMHGIWSIDNGRYSGRVKNLLENGGFEEGSGEDAEGWDNYPISYDYYDENTGLTRRQYRDKQNFHQGKYSLRFDYDVEPRQEGHHMHTYREVELPPYGQLTYVGSAWVNIPKTIVKNSLQQTTSPWGAYIVAYFQSRDPTTVMAGKGSQGAQEISKTKDWKKMEFEWKILSPGNFYANYYIYAGGMGYFWIDDMFLGIADHNISVAGDSHWQDYIVEATVNLNQLSGSDKCAGIIFRYLDADNYYLLTLDEKSDRLKLWKNIRGVLSSLTSGSAAIEVQKDYHLRIRCQKDGIKASLDEKEIISTKDNTFASGKIGLWVYGANTPQFDNIKVYELNK